MINPEGPDCDDKTVDEILTGGRYATLALSDGNDSYVLTLFYGYAGDLATLYFKSDRKGTKFDFLKSNSYVCGTIIDPPVPDRKPSVYRSVVFRGLVEVIHDPSEKEKALAMIRHPDSTADKDTLIMKLQIDEITGRLFP